MPRKNEFYSADYVVVGAGSAGAVIASRLSENAANRIILLEAGGEARAPLVQIPAGVAKMMGDPKVDWNYDEDPDPSINGRKFFWAAGKMLGGSSSINGTVFIRGTKRDYDRWEERGATGWDYAGVLPYFMRSESWSGKPSQTRGSHGPIKVTPMRPGFHPLVHTFIEACRQHGLEILDDYNSEMREGAFYTQTNQDGGVRCNTERAYLRSARSRPNLHVITHAEAGKILFEGNTAVGVTFTRHGRQESVFALREVIVCAGTIGSPALLMRSGIGPAEHLRARGIAVLQDRPQVGENLQEHPGVAQSKRINIPSFNSQTSRMDLFRYMLRYLWNRTGPMSSPAVPGQALIRGRPELEEPSFQIHFFPLSYDIDPNSRSMSAIGMSTDPMLTLHASLCHPESRGCVQLDDRGRPHVVHQMLGNDRDIAGIIDAMKYIDRLFQEPAMKKIIVADRSPNPIPTTDAEWAAYARAKASPGYHAGGSCRMGSDPESVVDPTLRVRGVDRLRVVDASIMPTLPSVNTNATAIMIGEKGAELIASAG